MKLNPRAEEFKRMELLEKYIAKLLYEQNDKKFEEKYLKRLEKNWNRWKNDRKECEEREVRKIDENRYLRRLEENIEWQEKDRRIIQENKKDVCKKEEKT